MELQTLVTKRWLGYYVLMFTVWYPVLFVLTVMYSVTRQPVVDFAATLFSALWMVFVSYLYFRRARNNWSTRFLTASGWTVLTFLFSAILLGPVYGQAWTDLSFLDVLDILWVNWAAILVGGMVAGKGREKGSSLHRPLF